MSQSGRRSSIKLTARGAIALALLSTFLGYVLAALTGWPSLVGVVFLTGSVLGVALVNPRELLTVVVTPPLVFFCGTLVVELGTALGSPSIGQSLLVGLFTALSAGAPWLFAGSAAVLAVAMRRGLRDNVRDLREELRSAAEVPRPRREQVFAPEPEGYFEPRVYGTPRDGA
ncbi:DUF6542 domain-containing protein [Thermoactinospora rubra]|uniref:DUF6542 domain-containing protein n=1 Tax=Thermoactinospora rubra TaxID=1088767 RepID=UPI000A103E68|nr:DUF6542 domain-containing protein [Thermoactinospora rubra]